MDMLGLVSSFLWWSVMPSSRADTVWARMESGTRVGIHTDVRLPMTVVEVWYPLSLTEDWQLSFVHLIEHLAFRTAGELTDGEFELRVETMGGESNGWTNHDWMVASLVVPPEYQLDGLDLSMELLGDLTRDLSANILESELRVIRQEYEQRIRRTDFVDRGSIRDLLYEDSHPYRAPFFEFEGLGAMELETVTQLAGQVLSPAGAALVVVTPEPPGEILEYLDLEALDTIPGSTPGMDFPTPEYRPGTVAVRFERRADSVIHMAWRLPADGHPDLDAIAMVGASLALGPGSILERALWRRRGPPVSVGYAFETGELASELRVSIRGFEGSVGRTIRRIDRRVRRISRRGLTEEEANRARIWLAGLLGESLTDPHGQAAGIAHRLLSRDSRSISEHLGALDALESSRYREVALNWLVWGRLAYVVLSEDDVRRVPARATRLDGS